MTRPHRIRPEDLLAHAAWARALARRLVSDEATAEDVVQEGFSAALRTPPEERATLRPWLARVLGNAARQRARSEGRRAARERETARAEALPSASELTERAESQRLLMDTVLGLDDAKREVVILRYYEGLSSAEIARRQGVPAGTVRARLKRALDELRERLDGRFGGDREQWQRALTPLVVAPAKLPAAVGLASLLTGALMLKTFLSVGAIALIGLALIATGAIDAPFSRLPAESVTFSPLEEVAVAPAVVPDAGARREVDVDLADAASPRPAEAAAASRVGTLRMRFVDPDGRPVAGVEASTFPRQSRSTAVSDAEGCAAVGAWFGGGPGVTQVHFERAGFAADVVSARGEPGCDIDLGDVRLHAGGGIEGQVVDGGGAPLEDVRVWVEGQAVTSPAAGGLRAVRISALGSVEARTDADGRFRLPGVLLGEARVQAESDDELWRGISGRVEVRAGELSRGLVIVAEEVPAEDRVEGIVLDPSGDPVPWARVRARWRTWLSSGSLSQVTGRDGRFRIVMPKRVPLDLVVRDSDDAWAPVSVEDVEPGTLDLVVRFAVARTFTVALEDRAGAPVTEAVLLVGADGRDLQRQDGESAEGVHELRLPGEPFDLTVLADGFAEARLEGIDPASVDDAQRVVLDRMPGIRGTVTAAGAPVDGATVAVQELARQRVLVSGLPSRLSPDERASATTDAEGAFDLTLRESGRYVVRAEAPGYAPVESAPFDHDPATGVADLALELSEGGAIEGRVVAANGLRESHVVLASRGDGRVQTVRSGPDGRYRLEHLAPGPWRLRVVAEEVPGGVSSSSTGPGSPYAAIQGDCVVAEGAVTVHDIFLGDGRPGVTLAGTLRVEGGDAGAWTAALNALDAAGAPAELRRTALLAPDGSFTLEGPAPGRYALLLVRDEGGDGEIRVLVELDLAGGESAHVLELAMGEVTAGAAADREAERLLWRGPDGAFGLARLPAVGAALRFPAGTVERVRLDPSLAAFAADPREWTVVEAAILVPGESLRVAE